MADQTTGPGKDHPDVIVHPPILVAAALVAGFLLEWVWPLGRDMGLAAGGTRLLGALLLALGVALLAWAVTTFRRAETNVPTFRPALKLVDTGPYAYTRNPIYVGGTAGFLGIALLLANPWLIGLAVVVVLVLHFGVVKREEAYLGRLFGTPYADYCRRVPRWVGF